MWMHLLWFTIQQLIPLLCGIFIQYGLHWAKSLHTKPNITYLITYILYFVYLLTFVMSFPEFIHKSVHCSPASCKCPCPRRSPWDPGVSGSTGARSLEGSTGSEFQKRGTERFDGLVQERCNSSALAMELHLSCTNPSTWDISQGHFSPKDSQTKWLCLVFTSWMLNEKLLSYLFIMIFQMAQKERQYMTALAEEWKRRDKEREILLQKKVGAGLFPNRWIISLWPSDAIWRHWSGSILAQVRLVAITWTNVDLSSMRTNDNHLEAI